MCLEMTRFPSLGVESGQLRLGRARGSEVWRGGGRAVALMAFVGLGAQETFLPPE